MIQPPEEDVSVSKRCWIAELSDKLLLEILSRVSRGLTLLDAVPLVCRRWRDLARDPRAWSGVTLEVVGRTMVDGRVLVPQYTARLLLHAPALQGIHFSSCSWQPATHALDACLRRCTVNVREMHGLKCQALWENDAVRRAVLDLVHRCRDHLRILSELPVEQESGSAMLLLVRDLPHLAELVLAPSSVTYKGELRSCPPALRRLSFNWDAEPDDQNTLDLLGDLLAGASRSLRFAGIWMDVGQATPAPIVERLARCVELRSLSVGFSCFPALRELRELRELELLDFEGTDEGSVVELPRAGSLPHLRSLKLDGVEAVQVEKGLVTALARAAPNTTHLYIDELYSSHDEFVLRVGEMLDAMPRLEHIGPRLVCGVDCVPKLMALANLKKLDVTVRCPPSRMTHFLGLVAEFKALRPKLKASICVELIDQDFTF